MISVIIPTVQKRLKVLKKQLASLERDTGVTEIIIINNKPESPLDFSEFSKVKIHTPEENLYVNKSWNLGVSMAKNEIFCLMNDDVIFPDGFCSAVVKFPLFNEPNTGLVGMWWDFIKNFPDKEDLEPISEPNLSNMSYILLGDRILGTSDWGISIFGKKSNYYEIPSKYKIIYGDNWLLYKNLQAGKQNYGIYNQICHHIHSASSGSNEFMSVVISDIEAANNSEEFGEYLSKRKR